MSVLLMPHSGRCVPRCAPMKRGLKLRKHGYKIWGRPKCRDVPR